MSHLHKVIPKVINPRRACARVTVVALCVYLSVRLLLLQRPLILAANDTQGFVLGFSWINMSGISKKPSVQELWREKANMQMY